MKNMGSLKMAVNWRAYTIQPVIIVKGNTGTEFTETTDVIYVKQFQITVEDNQWREIDFYNDLERTLKRDVLPFKMPFKQMKSFENIKHYCLQYIIENAIWPSVTSTHDITNSKVKRVPSVDHIVTLFFYYKIEDTEKDLWESFILNLRLIKLIRKNKLTKDSINS